MNLPTAFFAGAATLGAASDVLDRKLGDARYLNQRYYELPDHAGFALVTLCEQTTRNCKALPEPDRWSLNTTPCPGFSVACMASSLVFPKSGYWRAFVFIVTDRPIPKAEGEKPTSAEARDWFSNGSNKLPDALRPLAFTAKHYGAVLLYEFEKKEAQPVVLSSRFGSATHLHRVGLLP